MLTRPHSLQLRHDYDLAGASTQTSVGAQLAAANALSGPSIQHIYHRDIAMEVGFFNASVDTINSLYSTTIYPQGLCFDETTDEVFIMRGSLTGANQWAWFEVYDLGNPVPKTIFTAEKDWRETVNVVYEGGNRYLYSLDRLGNAYRINITTLPANMAHVTTDSTYAIGAFTQMCPVADDGWAVNESRTYWGLTQRNRLTRWNRDMTAQYGQIVLDWAGTGILSDGTTEFYPKIQGFCNLNGFYYGGMGGDFDDSRDLPTLAEKHHGLTVFTPNGTLIAQGLTDPLQDKAIWQNALGYEPSIIEVESVAPYKGDVYMMWITRLSNAGFTRIDGKGIVISREMSRSPSAIDFSPAASGLYRDNNQLRRSVEVHYAGFQMTNPIDGGAMNTFPLIVDYMRRAGLSRYAFYGVGQTITDYNAAPVALSTSLVEFVALSTTDMFITLTDSNRIVRYRISGIGGTPVQTKQVVAFGEAVGAAGDDFVRLGIAGSGKNATGRNGTSSLVHHEFYNPNGIVGTISTSASATAYNTTSDVTLKDDLGEMSAAEALSILALFKFHDFTWKVDGSHDRGAFAQELYEVYPNAVTPGGTNEDGVYRPWSVDYSKLVPVLGRALQAIDARLSALEGTPA